MRVASFNRRWIVLAATATATAAAAGPSRAQAPPVPLQPPVTARTRAIELRVRPRLQAGLAQQGVRLGAPLYFRVVKQTGQLEVWARGQRRGAYVRVRAYDLCGLEKGLLGPRRRRVPAAAPEGFYQIYPAGMSADSANYLKLTLDYPNARDVAAGWDAPPAGFAGGCAGTVGLGATDPTMEELWAMAAASFRAGQSAIPVHVFPFAMTARAMRAAAASPWIGHWAQLEPAWRLFEAEKKPPATAVRRGRYVVTSGS
jgi:murein L,D-transpeptidase YafK